MSIGSNNPIEFNQTDNPEFINVSDRDLHIEHILPQSFSEVYGWKHVIEDNRDGTELVHTLGNLTLLSGKKNIQASNDSFENKISIYQGKGKYGNSDDKVSSYRITQKIFDDYNNGEIKRWDFDTINKRKTSLLEEVEQILSINLQSIK